MIKCIVTDLEPNIETGELGLAGAFGWIAEQGYKLLGVSVLRSGKYVLFYKEVNKRMGCKGGLNDSKQSKEYNN